MSSHSVTVFANLFFASLLLTGLFTGSVAAQSWELVWVDEFEGSAVDESKWSFMTGDGCDLGICGWGNNELQWYKAENATVENSLLVITAKEERVSGKDYTSARLRSMNKGDWTYGRIEARARLPIGKGLWPAIWMLPTDEAYGGWAASGEIDIMEYVGDKPEEVLGAIHFGGPWPRNTFKQGTYRLSSGTFHDDFHVFAIEWEANNIRWYVDGTLFASQTDWWSEGGAFPAPFDQRFHLLLNLAVGGNLPGSPDASTVFPQRLEVDYVRVYKVATSSTAPEIVFDDMEHGNPLANSWFQFNGDVGDGGIGGNTDVPPQNGGSASMAVGFGGSAGFVGGFGRRFLLDLATVDHFNFWINPRAGQAYTLELNLQDDDDGDNEFPFPSPADDEFQYNCVVGPTGPCAVSGGGWQLVEIPFSNFFHDTSIHGGNGVLDPVPTSAGGNGQLVNVVVAIIGTGTDVNFNTDYWVFTEAPLSSDVQQEEEVPATYRLGAMYPNPFNPQARFELSVTQTQHVVIEVFDLMGRTVARLHDGTIAGNTIRSFTFDGTGLPSGVYFVAVQGAFFSTQRSVILQK